MGREYSCRRGAELRDGQPLKPGNYVIADNKISMCSERCGRAGAAANWFTAQRPVGNNARLDLDTVDVNPSAQPRRPRPQNDAALHEAVRAHWREVVRRARPVHNAARLDPDVADTARLDPDVVADTARLDPNVADTARLDPDTRPVESSVAPRRPRQRKDASLYEAVRAHWREVVHRTRPVDITARLDLGVDNTARLDRDRGAVKPWVPREPRL